MRIGRVKIIIYIDTVKQQLTLPWYLYFEHVPLSYQSSKALVKAVLLCGVTARDADVLTIFAIKKVKISFLIFQDFGQVIFFLVKNVKQNRSGHGCQYIYIIFCIYNIRIEAGCI